MPILIILTLLPLAAIVLQLALNLHETFGFAGYSLYKLCFIVPPLIYCRRCGVGLFADILKFRNWRRQLPQALGLGVFSIALFWVLFATLGDRLLDTELIAGKLDEQFSVSLSTVFLVAPFTIFVNSLLEEFFYRGFAFGLLMKRHRALGTLLPALVFTVHHILFMMPWLTAVPLAIATAGLFVLALVLQRLYERADSIVAPWLLHLLGDVAMMSVAVSILAG